MTSYFGVDSGYGKVIDGNYSNYTFNSTVTVTRVNGPLYYPGQSANPLDQRLGVPYTNKSAKIYCTKRPIVTFVPLNQTVSNTYNFSFYDVFFSKGIALEAVVWETDGWVAYFSCGLLVDTFSANVFISVAEKVYTSSWGLSTKDPLGETVFHSESRPIEYYGHADVTVNRIFGNSFFATELPNTNYHIIALGGCLASISPTVSDNFEGCLWVPMAVLLNNTLFLYYWMCRGTLIYTNYGEAYNEISSMGYYIFSSPETVNRQIHFFNPL